MESHSTLWGGEEVDALEGVLMDKWEPTSMQVLHHTPLLAHGEGGGGRGEGRPRTMATLA